MVHLGRELCGVPWARSWIARRAAGHEWLETGRRAAPNIGEQIVFENHPQCMHIGSRSGLAALLFRRGIRRRPQEGADPGLVRSGARRCSGIPNGRLHVRGHQLGDPEVDDPRLAALVDENVARLQVTMDDALVVGHAHGTADFPKQLQSFHVREPVVGTETMERRTADDQFHGHEDPWPSRRRPVTRLVHPGDSAIVEPREQIGLLGHSLRLPAGMLLHLDRHLPARRPLAGQEDTAEASLSQPIFKRVASVDRLADEANAGVLGGTRRKAKTVECGAGVGHRAGPCAVGGTVDYRAEHPPHGGPSAGES